MPEQTDNQEQIPHNLKSVEVKLNRTTFSQLQEAVLNPYQNLITVKQLFENQPVPPFVKTCFYKATNLKELIEMQNIGLLTFPCIDQDSLTLSLSNLETTGKNMVKINPVYGYTMK